MQSYLFVGIDTHKASHTAACLDSYFNLITTITFSNNYQGFIKFLSGLENLAQGKTLLFGLEDSQGLGSHLAEYLTKKGLLVVDINPVLTDRGRKHTAHRDKSDERDAILIAKTLIKEKDNLHNVKINKNSLALRELVKYRQLLVEESTRIKNRLHVLIFSQYPEIINIFTNLFGRCALAFFSKYSDPLVLKKINVSTLTAFLRSNSKGRYGKIKARAILSNQENNVGNNLADTRASIIRKHIDRLSKIQEELEQIKDMLKVLLEKSSYVCLTSIPGIDTVTAAKIISQIVDISRFASSSKLAKFAGIAPTENSTGRKKKYQKSKHGKRYLYSTIYFVALAHISRTRNGLDKNSISRAYYLKKISEGKTKKEAITCLSRRLIDVIYAIMRDKSLYNFSKSKFVKQHIIALDTAVA